MANRWAVASGNWSNTATWNGGTLPTSADDVFSNTFTVTIDQNVTALSLRNTSASGITAGGGFTVSGAYTINCSSGAGFVGAGTTYVLTCTNAVGVTVTVQGNTSNGTPRCLRFNQAGTVNYTGTVNPSNATSDYSLIIDGTGTSNITGNISSGNNAGACGIATSSPTVNVTGNVTGAGSNTSGIFILSTSSNSILNVTGTVASTGGGASQGAIRIEAAGSVTVTGAVNGATASSTGGAIIITTGVASNVTINGTLTANAGPAFYNATSPNATLTVSGPFISSSTGILPILSIIPVKVSSFTNNSFQFAKNTTGNITFYTSDVTSGAPTANNVRSGTVYANGSLTGTLVVPNPAYVALGVATDDTVGSLAYNSDSAIADYLWNKQTSALTTSGSIGERLKNAATVDTTGSQLSAFGGP